MNRNQFCLDYSILFVVPAKFPKYICLYKNINLINSAIRQVSWVENLSLTSFVLTLLQKLLCMFVVRMNSTFYNVIGT